MKVETKLKAKGYRYSEPYAQWDYPHLITPDGGIVPVDGLDDPYIQEIIAVGPSLDPDYALWEALSDGPAHNP
jgi:hypothetical protein